MLKIYDTKKTPAEFCDGWFTLQGEKRWIVKGDPSSIAAIKNSIPSFANILNDDLLELDFVNQIGTFDLSSIADLKGIKVKSGKWEEEDYKSLLLDLVKIASNLPFSAADAATQRYDRSVRDQEDALYHAFVYLEYVMSDSAPAWERLDLALLNLLRNPHRKMIRETHEVMVWQARDIRPSQMVDIACGVGEVFPTRSCEVARKLGGFMPLRVNEQKATHTFDTPENRFVRSFLDFASGIVEQTKDVFCGLSPLDRTVQAECVILENKLTQVSRHSLWNEVGSMVHFPAASTVLQRRMGYREVFSHYIRLLLATRLPLDDDLGVDQLQMKDVALLYEMWCFFKVVEAVEEHCGMPAKTDFTQARKKEITVPWKMKIEWMNGVSVLYNASFTWSSKVANSYSTTLRPDITLEIRKDGQVVRHLFDAKFRLKSFNAVVSDNDDDSEREERQGTYKRADLYKMHAYRDAIADVDSVWILYPGTKTVFFTQGGIRFVDSDIADIKEAKGVGAISLLPGKNSKLNSLVDHFIRLK